MKSDLFRKLGTTSPDAPMFISLQGKRMSIKAAENMFRKYGEYTGIPLTPHTCRAVYASTLDRATNGNIALVTKLLGNQSLGVTMTHYIESRKTADMMPEDAAEIVGF